MKISASTLTRFAAIALLPLAVASCVSTKKYKALDASKGQCEDEKTALLAKVAMLELDTTQKGSDYRALMTAKNELEQTSSSEKSYLNTELSQKGNELQQKEKLLKEREKKIEEMQEKLDKQAQMVQDLKARVTNALLGYQGEDLSVEMRNGKVYVSLSENLLFKSGSAVVDPKGKEAINKLAKVLEKNPDIDILVEGHTDNVPLIPGKFDDNWDLSAARALSIVRILTQDNSVDPRHVTAAGRGEYVPVASNDSPEGKARNRRTEIILSPRLDVLFQILEGAQK